MKNLKTTVCIILGAGLLSCAYNNEEELYPVETCDTSVVTFHGTIEPILSYNCYECHGGSAQISGIPLEGYENIKAMVDAGRVIGALRHLPGFSAMPKDRASLAECDILKIEKWISEGAPNN